MEADFMYEWGKKDPDATIQMIENHTDQLLIQTHVDMEESGFLIRTGPQLTDLIDEEFWIASNIDAVPVGCTNADQKS